MIVKLDIDNNVNKYTTAIDRFKVVSYEVSGSGHLFFNLYPSDVKTRHINFINLYADSEFTGVIENFNNPNTYSFVGTFSCDKMNVYEFLSGVNHDLTYHLYSTYTSTNFLEIIGDIPEGFLIELALFGISEYVED